MERMSSKNIIYLTFSIVLEDNTLEVENMSKLSERLREYVEACPENTIIEIGALYREFFSHDSETAFAKAVERMVKAGDIVQITRGVYYKPRRTDFGVVPLTDNAIADHYMRDGHGIAIGYKLYNDKGISTQVGKNVEILSDSLPGEQKRAGNVKVTKSSVGLTSMTIPVIETMEILQNYSKIEDLNRKRLAAYMKEFASNYSEEATHEVISKRKYKKSTIAFLKAFLDYLNVPNTLGRYLSELSNYKIPRIEDIYETA